MPIIFPRENNYLSDFERIVYEPQLSQLICKLDEMGLNKTKYDDFNGEFWDDEDDEFF